MSSDDDERPPKQLLQPLTQFRLSQPNSISLSMASHESSTSKKPYQIAFSSRDAEIQHTQKLMENCTTYNGDPDQLSTWLRDTGAFIAREGYPETDHPFIIRHLLVDDALDYYLAHEDIIFNFYDLRKLFLHKQNVLTSLRTLTSLDSIPTLPLNTTSTILTSTQLPATTTTTIGHSTAATMSTLVQTLEDLTQNDIRKTIIEDLQRNTTKFTGDQQQDVIKWLKNIELKFEIAGVPAVKRFDLISQLLDKGALDWFQDNKSKFNNSWSEFLEHFKKIFDSPNRARIAMQKLNSYIQSPTQDIRSFCSEMRKLFKDADPQMSSTMKLELLLAKVNSSYRLDLLKQKPKDSEEFEIMAKDLENTYRVYDAIEQNSQYSASFTPVTYPVSSDTSSYSSVTRQQPISSSKFNNNNYGRFTPTPYNQNISTNPNYSSQYSSQNSNSWRKQSNSRQYNNNRSPGGSYSPHHNSQQRLSTYQPHSVGQHQPSLPYSIPPLMLTSSVPTSQPAETTASTDSSTIICQLCSTPGHSARDCPF